MIILEIRKTIIHNVIMNNWILKPENHTFGDTAEWTIFMSFSAVISLHVHGMNENANAIDPNGLTHLGAFHPQNSIAINRTVNILRIQGGTIWNNIVIGPGPVNSSSINSSNNSSSIKHSFFV